MAEIRCESCSALVPVAAAMAGTAVVAVCAFCGSRLTTRVSEPTGFETISYPQVLADNEHQPADSPDGAKTCHSDQRPSTGTALLIPGQSLQPPQPVRTLRRANLVVEGSGGAPMPLTGPQTEVGRKGAHIVIADPALSANHFVIEANGESFILRDLGSSNGTRLNGHRIRSAKLRSGDTIDAGETRFSFRVEEVIPWDRSH